MTISEVKLGRGLGAGEQKAKAVQQEAQVGRDQVDVGIALEVGISVIHSAQVVLKGHNVTLLNKLEMCNGN